MHNRKAAGFLVLAMLLQSCMPYSDALEHCRTSGRCVASDAGSEPTNLSPGGEDAGHDASEDAGYDASEDAGHDAGEDAGHDAGVDFEQALWPVPPDSPSAYFVNAKTVLDQKTLLVWQQELGLATTWKDAFGQCESLNTVGLGGASSGWTLPTTIELLSLVDSTAYQPAINSTVFPGTPNEAFWTASTDGRDGGTAWVVDFQRGGCRLAPVADTANVRCIRRTLTNVATPRYLREHDGGAILDVVTRLTWHNATRAGVKKDEAATYCASLDVDAGWRLPTKKELETIVDRQAPASVLDGAKYTSTFEGFFWASTTAQSTSLTSSWGVDFFTAQSSFTPDALARSVRCVH